MKKLFLLVAVFMTAACCTPVQPPTPTPIPVTDATPVTDSAPTSSDVFSSETGVNCAVACTSTNCVCAYRNVMCNFPTCPNGVDAAYSLPNAQGETFLTTCNAAVAANAHVNLACLVGAKTCADWKGCK